MTLSRASDLSAVILCGGLGTRIREETEFKPKPMVEIGGHPILWHIMKIYRFHGVRRFVLCLGYRGNVIRDFFINYKWRNADVSVNLATGAIETLAAERGEDWQVVLAETGLATQTGSRIKRALRHLPDERFFVTYGDGLADVDLQAVLDHHLQARRLATVTAVHPSSRFGELSIEGGLVTTFQEKPQTATGWINGGFMVLEKAAFERLGAVPEGDPGHSLEAGLLEPLAEDNQLAVYQHQGFWQCMDTFREMQLLERLWHENRAPWRAWDL